MGPVADILRSQWNTEFYGSALKEKINREEGSANKIFPCKNNSHHPELRDR